VGGVRNVIYRARTWEDYAIAVCVVIMAAALVLGIVAATWMG